MSLIHRVAVFGAVVSVLSFQAGIARSETAKEDSVSYRDLSGIERVEIGVESCRVTVFGPDAEKRYTVATAKSGGATRKVPYDQVGTIWKVVLNPSYSPTENARAAAKRNGSVLPETVPPGPGNPLGRVKLYFEYRGVPSVYGWHHTNHEEKIRDGNGNRITAGCVRGRLDDMREVARTLLLQDGRDADSLFAEADKRPGRSISIELRARPTVVYRK